METGSRRIVHFNSEIDGGHDIAFVSGPRQVGKSTLARSLLTSDLNQYLYDEPCFRRAWARSPEGAIAGRTAGPVVLDEIHKDRKWKTKLKGLYDKSGRDIPIIVTGSARLDLYRRGSDSLLGRYLPYRLRPFTVAETATPPSPAQVFGHSQVSYPRRTCWSSEVSRNRSWGEKRERPCAGAGCESTGWCWKIHVTS